jgi:predicted dehydrogenase
MRRVGIVGLGSIAAGYGTPEDEAPYTHAGGVMRSGRVELAAVADVSEEARERFRAKWGGHFPEVEYRDDLGSMLESDDLDIVAVCVRGPQHHEVMMQVIEAGPRAIFLEKPPSCSLAEMDEMLAAARAKEIPITVSYSRHWGPHVMRMAELVRDGLVGEVRHVTGYCGGGFLSFASHTTDMICQYAGHDPAAVYARGNPGRDDVPDGYEAEPSLVSVVVEFAGGAVGTQVGFPSDHGQFYCEVSGSEGRAVVPFYGKPRAFDPKGEPLEIGEMPPNASPFKLAYDQIAEHLDGGPLPDCTDEASVAVNEIGFGAIESAHTNARVALPNANRTRKVYANG